MRIEMLLDDLNVEIYSDCIPRNSFPQNNFWKCITDMLNFVLFWSTSNWQLIDAFVQFMFTLIVSLFDIFSTKRHDTSDET